MLRASFRLFSGQMVLLLVLCVVGFLVTPYADHFKGGALGLAISFYCMWLLVTKIERVTNKAAEKQLRFISLGSISRIAMAILGVMVLGQLDLQFVVWTLATGVLGGYLLMIGNCIYCSMKKRE